MRTKVDILDSTERNAKRATGADDILLIHSLHSLEVMIDIRDILDKRLQFPKTFLDQIIDKC